jgi:hypothetical protein
MKLALKGKTSIWEKCTKNNPNFCICRNIHKNVSAFLYILTIKLMVYFLFL